MLNTRWAVLLPRYLPRLAALIPARRNVGNAGAQYQAGSASSQTAISPQAGSTNPQLGRNVGNAGAQYQAGSTSSQAAISPQAGSTNPQLGEECRQCRCSIPGG